MKSITDTQKKISKFRPLCLVSLRPQPPKKNQKKEERENEEKTN
jgi:hypothetical protein